MRPLKVDSIASKPIENKVEIKSNDNFYKDSIKAILSLIESSNNNIKILSDTDKKIVSIIDKEPRKKNYRSIISRGSDGKISIIETKEI